MLANMAMALVKHEQITTTLPKAKELRPYVEKLVTLGKRGDLHARRLLIAKTRDAGTASKLIDVLGPRYAERPGGYACLLQGGLSARRQRGHGGDRVRRPGTSRPWARILGPRPEREEEEAASCRRLTLLRRPRYGGRQGT